MLPQTAGDAWTGFVVGRLQQWFLLSSASCDIHISAMVIGGQRWDGLLNIWVFFSIQFKKSPPKIPYKAIALAVVLFMIGTFLIIIGALLLAGYISKGVSGLITSLFEFCIVCPYQSLPRTIISVQKLGTISKKVIPSTAAAVFADSSI